MAFKKYKYRKSHRGVRRRRAGFGMGQSRRGQLGMFRHNVYTKRNIHQYKRVTDFANLGTYDSKNSAGTTFAFDQFITMNTAASVAGIDYFSLGIGFSLADLQNSAEFTALYDAYRLDYVKLKFLPCWSNSISITGAPHMQPSLMLHYCIDKDDNQSFNAANSGIESMREYDSYKIKNNVMGLKYFQIGLKPRVAMTVYNTGLTAAYAEPTRAIFLNANNDTVPHYGVKMIFESYNGASATSVEWKLRVSATYYFTMKDVR